MPNNSIQISIPTRNGKEYFHMTRKAVWAFLLFITFSPALLVYGYFYSIDYQEVQNLKLNQMELNFESAQQQIGYLDGKSEQFETLYQAQIITNHSLAQELEDKKGQIVSLGQRVNDVETVLGLSYDESQNSDLSLEDRIDAAAIDSAVRATLFRLIPNQAPMEFRRISSEYGYRTHPITKKRHFHRGLDMTCQTGEPIYAPADGVVEFTRPSNQGYGNYLKLRHSFGFMTSYAHMKSFNVRSGQFISKGDLVGQCGNSGISTGAHLHYEVRFLGRTLNPANFVNWNAEQFDQMFENERSINWSALLDVVNKVVKQQVLLTQQPTEQSSLESETIVAPETASNTSVDMAITQ
ncbi:M23 family metallopeptidase [Vibrio tapetis]|uniref:Putative Peptidase M23 n=1 Tax=Vibrio tapetis subsp. tapetis TaxID=1671868 RepID=A0A2N8ZF48_9VIBR|nr:M23 family metallopeptidase [Vibrio tapetis]SON50518.1 putative Peptidase M23 [Vibrio tapetis subsp. tapetis]